MNDDMNMEFTEVPLTEMAINSDLPGGKYVSNKANTFLETLQKYFNITTNDFVNRIKNGINPNNKSFLVEIDNNPDLYGPFWISITVSILCFALGNISVWIHHEGKFVYNFQSFVSTLNLISIFIFGYPFAIWLYKKSMAPKVVIVMSLYGYSLPYLVLGSFFLFLFGFKFGFICSAIIGCIGTFSIFTKFINYQNSSNLGMADQKFSAIVAGPYFLIHIIVSFICFH